MTHILHVIFVHSVVSIVASSTMVVIPTVTPDIVYLVDACFVYQNGSIYDENGHNVYGNSYG